MKISTMTCLFSNRREDGSLTPVPEAIRRCKAAGFDTLDLFMCPMDVRRKQLYCDNDWETRVEETIAAAQEYHVTFFQSHPPYRPGCLPYFEDPEDDAFFRTMERRSLEITARVGADWAVLHPVCDPALGENADAQIELNHRLFDDMVEQATKLGIGIAFENMVQFPNAPYKFAARPEELAALCDSFHAPNVGICWDFGHANLSVSDRHEEALRFLGSRLKTTHIHDNLGVRDDHFLPFMGDIPWEKLMPVLKEIGFEGTLNLEIGLNNKMPDGLRDEAAHLAASAVKKLLNLTEG